MFKKIKMIWNTMNNAFYKFIYNNNLNDGNILGNLGVTIFLSFTMLSINDIFINILGFVSISCSVILLTFFLLGLYVYYKLELHRENIIKESLKNKKSVTKNPCPCGTQRCYPEYCETAIEWELNNKGNKDEER